MVEKPRFQFCGNVIIKEKQPFAGEFTFRVLPFDYSEIAALFCALTAPCRQRGVGERGESSPSLPSEHSAGGAGFRRLCNQPFSATSLRGSDFGGVEPPKSRGTLPKILSPGIFGSVPLRVCSFDCSNAVKGKFLLAQLARFWRRRAAKIVRGKLLFSPKTL